MRLEIGKRVVVLDDTLEGIVTNISNDVVEIQDDDGMTYQFHKSELIPLREDQRELTKYSDINNDLLKQKAHQETKNPSNFQKQKNKVVMEVDLHINQLVDSTRGMDNFDMLNLQIQTAKRKLEYAIKNRISYIVFIHGVGEGVLKSELHFLLKRYSVDFYDASYQKYGLGATEVYIYQNPKS